MVSRKLVIGICTYKRPELILLALDSVNKALIPDSIEPVIVVVDNDPVGSAQLLIENYSKTSAITIYYSLEKNRGIPFARNNFLRISGELGADLVAFIDDDEIVDPLWLAHLIKSYDETDADCVLGYVKTVYPEDTPEWIVVNRLFQREQMAHHLLLETANSGNILFDYHKFVGDLSLYFNESFGLTGGSDAEYFNRAVLSGCIIRWVSDSVVYEPLEKKRMSYSYYFKRAFRTSNDKTFFRKSLSFKVKMLFKSWIYLNYAVISLPFRTIFVKYGYIKSLTYLLRGIGFTLACLGIYINWKEYR